MKNEILGLCDYDCINQYIKNSWDKNVKTRALDLEKATDSSYLNLIMPWVVNKVLEKTSINSNIIDLGCGCGYLTNTIYNKGRHNITGVDISPASIDYAREKYPYISFVCEDICKTTDIQKYDLCLAVMVLNNMPNIKNFFNVIQNILTTGGTLLLVIPHPCFWPQQHLKEPDFIYAKEKTYEFNFATQGCKDYSSILYFHRMLETYLDYIKDAKLILEDFHEIVEPNIKRKPDILCMELTFLPTKEKMNMVKTK